MKQSKLYWAGNSAKMKVIQDILARITKNETLVFDYGCGDGGDWPDILRDYPGIKLIGYEPYSKSYEAAKKKLVGYNAELYTGSEIHNLSFKADFIVSFSVLEHVYNRHSYLETAKKHLAPDGLLYLNYDDGHFRNILDLNRPLLWLFQLKEYLHNILAYPMGMLGMVAKYQGRVYRRDLDELIYIIGLQVIKVEYSNLVSLKLIQKTIPIELRKDFSQFWIDVESRLNSQFCLEGEAFCGDTVNLWQQMPSKTLILRVL